MNRATKPGVTGTVQWFNDAKGYGFLSIEGEAGDYFVHQEHVCMNGFRSLRKGQKVRFDAVQTEKGWQARKVTVIE